MMNFEEANDNMDYRRIMDKVGSRYNRAVDQDELESLKLLALWECTKNYDPSKIMVIIFVILFMFVFSKGVEVLTKTNSYSIKYDGPKKTTLERILEFVD